MKKSLLILSALVVLFAVSCNRNRFEGKLDGTWSLDRYVYAGSDQSLKYKDTVMNKYALQINAGQTFSESWQTLTFTPGVIYKPDTTLNDTVHHYLVIQIDTIRFVDTTITPFAATGSWDLLNSESDLQLHYDSANSTKIWRILTLSSSNLNLQNGNEDRYLKK